MEKNVRVLVSAFEGEDNSSCVLLEKVDAGNIIKLWLPNEYHACGTKIKENIVIHKPDYVIALGRKPLIKKLYVEPLCQRNGRYIHTNFDVSILEESLIRHQIPYKVSDKISNYLCNHVFYQGLDVIEKEKLDTKMIFIHTPDLKNCNDMERIIQWMNEFIKELCSLFL